MNELLEKITASIELGKINADSPYPPDMKGQPGADELTRAALDAGISPEEILREALIIIPSPSLFLPCSLSKKARLFAAGQNLSF